MAIEIIRPAGRYEVEEFKLVFPRVEDPTSAYQFPCYADGTVCRPMQYDSAQSNYEMVLANPESFFTPKVERYAWMVKESKIGRCTCGREVWLDSFTNSCECGKEYNMGGQTLNPRQMWGEETGESFAAITYDY